MTTDKPSERALKEAEKFYRAGDLRLSAHIPLALLLDRFAAEEREAEPTMTEFQARRFVHDWLWSSRLGWCLRPSPPGAKGGRHDPRDLG